MNRRILLGQYLPLFLGLGLALPGHSYALRPLHAGGEEGDSAVNQALRQTLLPAAGLEGGAWQAQMWKVLAEGFGIPLDKLQEKLQPTDLRDFRFSPAPEALGPKIDLYARMLLVKGLPDEKRQRLISGLTPLIEPSPHYPQDVTEAFERMINEIAPEKIKSSWDQFISVARARWSELPQGDSVRELLDRIAGEARFTPEQQEMLRTTARRVVQAFHPSLEGDRREAYVELLLSITWPISVESLRPFLPLRVSRLRERHEEGEPLEDLIEDLLPRRGDFLGTSRFWEQWSYYRRTGDRYHLEQIPPGNVSVFLTLPDSQDVLSLVSVAAHEYAHFLLEEWERFESGGKTSWHWEHDQLGQSTAHADWITTGLAGAMEGWVALDRGEAIPITKAVHEWLGQMAREWVSGSAEPDPADLELLENLPAGIRRYVQGVLVGEIAEGVGRKIVSQRVGGNPYELAASFLGWYAKQPWDGYSPSLQSVVSAARDFISKRAGLARAVADFRLEQRPDFAIENVGFLLEGKGLAFAPVLALLEARGGVFPDVRFAGVVETPEEMEGLLKTFASLPQKARSILAQRLVVIAKQPGDSRQQKYALAKLKARHAHLSGLVVVEVSGVQTDLLAQLNDLLATVGYQLPEDDPAVREAALTLLRAA